MHHDCEKCFTLIHKGNRFQGPKRFNSKITKYFEHYKRCKNYKLNLLLSKSAGFDKLVPLITFLLEESILTSDCVLGNSEANYIASWAAIIIKYTICWSKYRHTNSPVRHQAPVFHGAGGKVRNSHLVHLLYVSECIVIDSGVGVEFSDDLRSNFDGPLPAVSRFVSGAHLEGYAVDGGSRGASELRYDEGDQVRRHDWGSLEDCCCQTKKFIKTLLSNKTSNLKISVNQKMLLALLSKSKRIWKTFS